MKLPYYMCQMEEAFLKLQKAKSLEMEAVRQFYEAKIEAISFDEKEVPVDTGISEDKSKVNKVIKDEHKEETKLETVDIPKDNVSEDSLENIEFPKESNIVKLKNGLVAVKVPLNSIIKKNEEKPRGKPIFCRDCHKQIKGEVFPVENNLYICEKCFEKRKNH